ncbi:MAG: glycosyltransferase family 2 protein [Ignavibacteriales bacterium]|nr:glycosyltransferase family 2 protein [Ignavibacteriales bacterium]
MPYQLSKQKYLQKYGYLKREVYTNIRHQINMVVVVPALAEDGQIDTLIESLQNQDIELLHQVLFLFVVNNPEDAEPEIEANNTRVILRLRKIINNPHTNLQIGYIDCSSRGMAMPVKDAGVGLARKTGMDAALNLFSMPGKDNVLVCLDADCEVSTNYLNELFITFRAGKAKTAAVRFEHRLPEEALARHSIIAYELFLLHYQLGMRLAESYYSYHSVGSTIACTAETYIKCEGMNMLKAGEDFYFLQKAAKLAKIQLLANAVVYPSARRSVRVPFGTGQRIDSYLRAGEPDYSVHNMQSFLIVKKWLNLFTRMADQSPVEIIIESEKISRHLSAFLVERGFLVSWAKIQKNGGDIAKQQRVWFDAFKTMMLLHHLRDSAFPDVQTFDGMDEMFQIYGQMPPVRLDNGIPETRIQEEYLEQTRKLVWNNAT